MSFITKKHLPRRTFLRGAGVAIALPLLDSMVPAQTPLGQNRRGSAQPSGMHLRSARRHDGQMDSCHRQARTSRSPKSSSRSRNIATVSSWSAISRIHRPPASAAMPAPTMRAPPLSS